MFSLCKNTPLDQCRCQTNENFIFMSSALKIDYSDNIWQNVLCDSENIDSDCWTGSCTDCSNGSKIVFEENSFPSIIKYHKWIVDEETNQRCVEESTDPKSLHLLLLSDFPRFQKHVQVKRIQESRFNFLKAESDIGITQMDFAMAYSCKYQNEIQSALWSRASINLFTLARFANQQVTCHLFVLDNFQEGQGCNICLP